ncbi:MAG TPA: YggS family pyridoxal phosphate-dependent enzyme [Ruminococcaceae bacterium]|nr:YggS family pyridoxal phosphate-dependent enzyme [Oscillospiraceae bacterium]
MTEKQLYDAKRFADIEYNLSVVRERVANAAALSGRKAEEIQIMAVSKTVEPVYINHAISLGMNLIGENKVQEYLGKKPDLLPHTAHLIGHLQTNKVKQIVGEVEMIESVDSVRLAKEIGKRAEAIGKNMKILAEINVGGEKSKSGIPWDAAFETIAEISEIVSVELCGLMAIPPVCEKKEDSRAFFSKMMQMFVDIRSKNIDNTNIRVLSMGMSSDYYEAVLEGSNLVRVGTSIFGGRIYR